ncbi:serine/threonine-protein kinase [Streptomyces varsoviensis]|uniref:serine/threonine-protein kinase n=1 Tax=Streptomyces varsoviensis TaxID=67373 RepID=UPI0004CAF340|nr:serine/threonine-protein kinase [Streptomyces varsoviensis]
MSRVIDGRFELADRLGSGGMGMVWRARDLALHRDVALKEVRPPDPALAENDPAAARVLRDRVLREARALARLDHPNVVTIHHIVDEGEGAYPWIVMELVPGAGLQERLARGPLPPAEAARIGRGVLAALRAAHAAGIQHRDVKPANVLLRPDGRPVLTDFGIAAIRDATSLTATGALIGSPDYMAPERLRGHEGDPASDLWSLGMLLYVAVEGRHPLRKASTLATLAAILDEPVPAPEHAGPLTPVLTALLTRDTAARPDAESLDRMLAEAEAETGREKSGNEKGKGKAETSATPAPPARTTAKNPTGGPASPVRTSAKHSEGSAAPARTAVVPPARTRVMPSPTGSTGGPGGPGGGRPRGSSSAPAAPLGEREARRRVRRARVVPLVTSLVGTAVTAALVWALLPAPEGQAADDGPDAKGATGAAGSANGRDGTDLLTPDGVRTVIRELKPVMGGARVTDFTVHEKRASAEAPTKGDKNLYDHFAYEKGKAARERAGGTLMPGTATVDLDRFRWDALPGLLRQADNELGVAKPTSHFVDVDPAEPFLNKQPVLKVYVTDAYGSAYLVADLDGKVIQKNPRRHG